MSCVFLSLFLLLFLIDAPQLKNLKKSLDCLGVATLQTLTAVLGQPESMNDSSELIL